MINVVCSCCGFVEQKEKLTLCTDLQQVRNIGVSTYLYFRTLKTIIQFLLLMLLVFSIYAIASNVVASNSYRATTPSAALKPQTNSFQTFMVISLGSKQLHQTEEDRRSYEVQCWLGVAMVVLWGVGFGVVKRKERADELKVDKDNVTVSDFSVLVGNYPRGLTIKDFETQINEYKKKIQLMDGYVVRDEIKVAKINIVTPFYLNSSSFKNSQLQKINKRYKQLQKLFISWIKQRQQSKQFSSAKQHRYKAYSEFDALKSQRQKQYLQIASSIREQMVANNKGETVPAFITFKSDRDKDFVMGMHDIENYGLRSLPCFNNKRFFTFEKIGDSLNVLAEISDAPEPENVIWTNMGQSKCQIIMKKVLTFTLSVLILGASFAAIYGLSKVQTDYSRTATATANQYISFLISLCISLINILIQQALRYLTILQRDTTIIQQQASLGIKAVLALIVNSILIPILVNYFFKENLYGVNGLAYDVFYLGITNSLLSPILKILDPYFYFTEFMKDKKKQPQNKLALNQNQLNTACQYLQFETGYQYIYMVNLFLFVCFFSPLQPIIVVFAVAGLSLMFWAQKYSLLNRCKRPVPGNNLINTAMYQLIYMGPGFYALGSFCWSHFFKKDWIGIAPNLTAAILSGIILMIPYAKLVEYFMSETPQTPISYSQNRLFFPTEYDRLNPVTAKQGIDEYLHFLSKHKQQLSKKKPEQRKQIEQKLYNCIGRGQRVHYHLMPNFTNILSINQNNIYSNSQMVYQQLFGGGQAMSPYLVGNAILGGQAGLAVQNWGQGEIVNYGGGNGGETVHYGGQKAQYYRASHGNNMKNGNNGNIGQGMFRITQSHPPFHPLRNPSQSQQLVSQSHTGNSLKFGLNAQVSAILPGIARLVQPQMPPINVFNNLLGMGDTNSKVYYNGVNNYTQEELMRGVGIARDNGWSI